MENNIIKEIEEITKEILKKESQIIQFTKDIQLEKSKIVQLKEKYICSIETFLKKINKDVLIPIKVYEYFNFVKRQTGKRFDFLRKPEKYCNINYNEYFLSSSENNTCIRWNIVEERITSYNTNVLEIKSIDVSGLLKKLLKEKEKYKPFIVNSKKVLKKIFLISFSSKFKIRFSYFQFRTYCISNITEEEFNQVFYNAKLDFFMNHRDIHSSIEENEHFLIRCFLFKPEDFNEETRKAMRVRDTLSLLGK